MFRERHNPGFVYCLFEHQSFVDRWMPLRLLKHVLRILDRHIETTPDEKLPVVLPVVLHHSPTGWTAATAVQDLFAPVALDPAIAPFVPHFSFALDDLSHLSDQGLNQRDWADFPTLAAWLLRDVRNGGKWLTALPFWAERLARLRAGPQGADATLVIFSYLYSATNQSPEQINEAIAMHAPAVKDIAMTAAEQLIARGKIEGKLEGKLEGRIEGEASALMEVLQAKFGALSPDTRKRIKAADELLLRRWIVRAVVGPTLDFVFAES